MQAMRLTALARRCLVELADPSVAIEGLQAAVKVDPSYARGFLALASALYDSGDAKGAAGALERAAAAETDPARKAEIADAAKAMRLASAATTAMKLGESTIFLPAGDPDFQKAFVSASLAESAGLFDLALKSLDEATAKATPEQAKRLADWRTSLTAQREVLAVRTEAAAQSRRRDFSKATPLWQQVVVSPLCTPADVNAFAVSADGARQYVAAATILQSRAKALSGPLKETALRQAGRLRNRALLYKKARSAFDDAEGLLASDGIEAASVSYLAALEIDPFNSVYLAAYARAAMDAKRQVPAVRLAKMALESDEQGPHLALAVSVLDDAKLDLEGELAAQKLLLGAQSSGLPSREDLAAVYAARRDDKRVLQCFAKDDLPKLTRTGLSALGAARFDLKDYAGAEECFRRQTAIDPRDSQGFADLAGALLREKKLDEARAMARQAVGLGLTKHWSYREILNGK